MSNISKRFYKETTETDFNNLLVSGYYFGKLTQNTPDGTTDFNWIIEVQAFDNNPNYVYQRVTRASDRAIFTRFKNNGTWRDWEVLALKSDLTTTIIEKQFNDTIAVPSGTAYSITTFTIPYTVPSGYKFLAICRTWVDNGESYVKNAYLSGTESKRTVTVIVSNLNGVAKNTVAYASILFIKS